MSRSETSETFDAIGVRREGNYPPPDVELFAVFWDFLTSVKQVTLELHYVNNQRPGYLSSLPVFRASAHCHANHFDHLSGMSHNTFLIGTRSFLADLSAVAAEWPTVTVCCSRCPLDKLSKYMETIASLLVQYQLRQVISDIYSSSVSDMCW
ncbi:hypothetical protein B0T13DRAFT_497523 [Neurospora crassa]|nr:hypothetical protein B0T13DRAFT_497523 [Neurospora crassa]